MEEKYYEILRHYVNPNDCATVVKQLLSLHSVVSTCCEPIGEGFFLGTTCPKCKRPFRQVIE